MGALLTQRPDASRLRAASQLAAEPAIARALDWFSAQRRWINEKHLELCRIPAATFREEKRAEWMASQFRALGCDAKLDKAGNVIALPCPQHDGPYVALTAHLDTVLEPRSPDDIRLGADGLFHGPGVADNGAGLAALLAIARVFRDHPRLSQSSLPLMFIANTCEEGEGNLSGMRYICRSAGLASRIAAFLVLDGPAVDHITNRALASRRFEIVLSGPGGHSWSDYGVPNPVHALSRAITLFAEQPLGNGAGFPRSSFNFGMIEGGTSINAIPSSARAKVDLRSESGSRIDEMAALLTASLERAIELENERATTGRVTAKLREIGSRPAGQLPEDSALLAHLRSADALLGIRAHLDCASTDANIPLSLGIPALSIGAGGQGGGAHTPSEWFHPEGRELGLRRILITLCLAMRDLDPSAALGR
jgi:acetylornithine deacetylase/succinyl-diaminopimelate desuccinylase-like protein